MVSENDPRPAYLQVADHLRAAIAEGKLAQGQKLPAQKQLAKDYGVAPMTIANAIRQLRAEGLLVSSHGRGVFVRVGGQAKADEGDRNLGEAVANLHREVEDLRRQYGRLEALVIDLYGRTGQPFPHERGGDSRRSRRAAGT